MNTKKIKALEADMVKSIHTLGLRRLTPEDIITYWKDAVLEVVQIGMPVDEAENEDCVMSAFGSLVEGLLRAYLIVGSGTGPDKALGILILGKQRDSISGRSSLIVWAMKDYDRLPLELWKTGMPVLRSIAADWGCSKIIAITNIPRVIEIVTAGGGKQVSVIMEL